MKWFRLQFDRVEVSMRNGWLVVDMPLGRGRAEPRAIRRMLRRERRHELRVWAARMFDAKARKVEG